MKSIFLMSIIVALFNFSNFAEAGHYPAPGAGPDPIVYDICTTCNKKWAQEKALKNGLGNQTASTPNLQGKAAQGAGNSVEKN